MLHGIAMLALGACHSDPAANDASDDAEPSSDADDGACTSEPFDATDDAQVDCSTFVTLPCGMPEGSSVSECYPDLATCSVACRTNELFYCVLTPNVCTIDAGIVADAATTLECVSCLGGGRRPRGLVPSSARGDSFARLAHLEAASVLAFRDLERSLVSFGAPSRLVRAAARARKDERRHARAMTRLQKKYEPRARRERVRVERKRAPTFVELLVDGAIEGCVNETCGAVWLAMRARNARDARTARTLERIARDEANHAALAWEILRWGLPHISSSERHCVHARLERAFDALERDTSTRFVARAVRAATAREIAW